MCPGAVAVTRTSWCQCELPTCLRPTVRFRQPPGVPHPHTHPHQGPGLTWNAQSREAGAPRRDCSQHPEATLDHPRPSGDTGVDSATHSTVPEAGILLCCWLVRGPLRHRPCPNEQLFMERRTPLTHVPMGTMVIPPVSLRPGPLPCPSRPPHVARSHCSSQSPGHWRCYLPCPCTEFTPQLLLGTRFFLHEAGVAFPGLPPEKALPQLGVAGKGDEVPRGFGFFVSSARAAPHRDAD